MIDDMVLNIVNWQKNVDATSGTTLDGEDELFAFIEEDFPFSCEI